MARSDPRMNAPGLSHPRAGLSARKVKVALIVGALPPVRCGVGDYSRRLIKSLDLARVDLRIITDEKACSEGFNQAAVFEKVKGGWGVHGVFEAARFIRRWRPDVAHIQYPSVAFYAHKSPLFLPVLLRFMGIRVVATLHEPVFKNRSGFLLLFGLRAIVFLEDFSARIREMGWMRKALLRRVRIERIDAGPSIERVAATSADIARIRAACRVRENEIAALYFGFAYPAKGLEYLLRALKDVAIKLVLACDLSLADAYQARILRLIEDEGLSDRVVVTGYLPEKELSQLISAADFTIFPFTAGMRVSNSSYLVARAHAKLIVTTSTEKKGYVATQDTVFCAPGSAEALASAIKEAAKHLNSSRSAPADDPWGDIGARHQKLYRDLASP